MDSLRGPFSRVICIGCPFLSFLWQINLAAIKNMKSAKINSIGYCEVAHENAVTEIHKIADIEYLLLHNSKWPSPIKPFASCVFFSQKLSNV